MSGLHARLSSSAGDWIDRQADLFEQVWRSGQRPRLADYLDDAGARRHALLLELVPIDMEYRWQQGDQPRLEEYLAEWSELRPELPELIGCECRLRVEHGDRPTAVEYQQRFPDLDARQLQEALSSIGKLPPEEAATEEPADGEANLPGTLPFTTAPVLPARIGRYAVRRYLGEGTFGIVYQAHDEQMDRAVAIKVSRIDQVDSKLAVDAFLREARNVARLKHPGVVTVHDFGVSDDGACYIVYEHIDGSDLKTRLAQALPSAAESAALVADVADALHYAHGQGLFHRDIKPANILLDSKERPYLIDFGLGIRADELADQAGKRAGSCLYMAPEMVRGEGHRIDARTDIYSLGVVLYEMLCGHPPFVADSREALFELILHGEPKPPRHVDDAIPRELDRICLKTIAKRVSDRYPTAQDFTEELRTALRGLQTMPVAVAAPVLRDSSGKLSDSSLGPPRIVPRGLRSFGAEDADFFLDLLPGPRDANNLPDSIRFWKMRIESNDADTTFSAGLIYGPSGCGKTSLVQAGLLPRLAAHVRPVYVEAVPDKTEQRILGKLQRMFPALGDVTDVAAAVARLRRGDLLEAGQKVVIVLDQFEQWLHGRGSDLANSPLVAAMRQADGVRVQFLVMIRDDFWLAVSRLFQELEIALVEGQNLRLVDLFDPRHARRVLESLGQAYGCLPERGSKFSQEQKKFVRQVVEGLSQDDKVISVRLSLFADMMKSRTWTPPSLQAVGGTEGVGVTFLEETFAARTASPEHRLYEKPARGLLAALLPEPGSDIKGRMRSRAELLEASGLTDEPKRFDRLIDILDRELRIITPTESDATAGAGSTSYYQLTHDYLVPSLRQWLRLKKLSNWRERAELCLEERAGMWKRHPDYRFLPTFREFAAIQLGVPARKRKSEQQAMMRSANRRYGMIAAWLALLLTFAGLSAWEVNGRLRARGLVQAICAATAAEAEKLIGHDLPPYRGWAQRSLAKIAGDEAAEPAHRLRASLACLPDQADYLGGRLLDCSADEFVIVREQLQPFAGALQPELWQTLRDRKASPLSRFRAGLALAGFAPRDATWTEADIAFLAEQLLTAHPDDQRNYRLCLEPLRQRLTPALEKLFDDPGLGQAAAVALADFGRDDPALLACLTSVASDAQYHVLFDALTKPTISRDQVMSYLRSLLEQQAVSPLTEKDRVELGRRRAGAAIVLMRLGERDAAFAVLQDSDDADARSQFIHRLKQRGIQPDDLLACLEESSDEAIRFGLLLALGEFAWEDIPDSQRRKLQHRLGDWHRHDPSPAIHGATGWLLRWWGFTKEVDEVAHTPLAHDSTGRRRWFVRKLGDEYVTFIVFPAGRYLRGSPACELERVPDEPRQYVTITRPFAIADREVTVAQWRRFCEGRKLAMHAANEHGDRPARHLSWFQAVEFCRWLTEQAGLTQQCHSGTPDWKFDPQWPTYRLPTEAEWEIACRAGAATTFSFGCDRSLLDRYAWSSNNSGREPHAVGTLRPNPAGLFDMHGNVWEWCQDCKAPYARDGQPDPLGEGDPDNRRYRSGSFDNYPRHNRASCRISDKPSYDFPYVGMRLACTVEIP